MSSKLSALGGSPEHTFNLADYLVKVKAAGAGDVLVTLDDFLVAIGLGAWTAYTPVVTLTGGGSNGNAVITGAHQEVGKSLRFWAAYTVGPTTSFVGMTAMSFSLPAIISPAFKNSLALVGEGYATISGNAYMLKAQPVSTTAAQLVAVLSNTTYAEFQGVAAAIPASWAAGSTWVISGTYEPA